MPPTNAIAHPARSLVDESHSDSEATAGTGVSLGFGGRLLYRLSRVARHRSAVHQAHDLKRTTDATAYRAWRARELNHQLTSHFDVARITGRDVLDFGCGTGELCDLLSARAPRTLIGLDISARAIRQARESSIARKHALDAACGTPACKSALYIRNSDRHRLPLADRSVDLICCFDVAEHIPDPATTVQEWARLLRPGGRVWIWWSPWRGPYGHHLESLMPLPWVHLLFPVATLFRTCAALYDDPDFIPRTWDRDPETGRKKTNKWRRTRSFHPFLNRLTRREFERTVAAAGLTILRRETHGFSGSAIRKATRMLLPLPAVGDCFVSYYVYELSRT